MAFTESLRHAGCGAILSSLDLQERLAALNAFLGLGGYGFIAVGTSFHVRENVTFVMTSQAICNNMDYMEFNGDIVLTYKYRLLPTKRQHKALAEILESQRILYNAALQERIDCYRKTGMGRSYIDQCKSLTELRKAPEFSIVPLNIQRWTIRRVDAAHQAFFRRVKAKDGKAGFPRFRGQGRWKTFGFNEYEGIRMKGKRLYFRTLPGGLRVHLHRPLPDGSPLGVTFTRTVKGWSVCLQYKISIAALPVTGKSVGIDMGLIALATLSTGEAIPNAQAAKRAERELRRRQRALARCKHGSKRRHKVKAVVTRLHTKTTNMRQTHLHQVSARLIRENDLIAVEKLNIRGLAASMLAKSINNAAWSKLKEFIAYKAAKAGRRFIEVDCRGTSQTCPECGQVAKKELKQRTHSCDCGCVLDRDHAAAIVILHRAVAASGVSQREALACA